MKVTEFLQHNKFPTSWMLSGTSKFYLLFVLWHIFGEEIPEEFATNELMRKLGYMQADGELKFGILKMKRDIRSGLSK